MAAGPAARAGVRLFFVVPLALTVMVSFWDYTEYALDPGVHAAQLHRDVRGLLRQLPELCVTLKTYLST